MTNVVKIAGHEIETPGVPNFVRPIHEPDTAFDVGVLSVPQIRALGRRWTAALIANSAKRRANASKEKTR